MVLFKNGGTVPFLITRGISCLYGYIRVVETSQLTQVQIMSGSRFTLFNHTFDPLPILTRRMNVWSERQSAHLNPMVLSKCHPISVKPLTVRGSQKHPSKLTNFLPKEHCINTIYIYQEIGNGHPPFDPFYLLLDQHNK